MWQKVKDAWFVFVAGFGAVIAYLLFIKKDKVELPERPTKYPGGDEKPEIPDAPKSTDWNKKIDEKFDQIVKEAEKADSNQDVIDRINEKYKENE